MQRISNKSKANMKGVNQRQRGAQGKHAADAEKSVAQQVMDLYHTKQVLELRISDYHKRPESQKKMLCDLFREITLCKIPARDNKNDLIFYLGKEARV